MSSSDRSTAIEARSLGYAYDGRTALAGIDLEVGAGEIVGLLGPNGSGKSTLVKILSRVLARYSGSALLGGREIHRMRPREIARQLAVVPQEPVFSFPFTALEVVLMGRHPHLSGLSFESTADIAIGREALERCGAEEFTDRPIQELSAGERQRVVFARALAQQPDYLLLDEPASFLDVRHQVEIYDLVRQLAAERNTCILTVLHDLNLAAEYCDRLYLLREGTILAGGATEEVFTYTNLKETYGTEIYVDVNDLTGKLLAIPLSGRVQEKLREDD